MVWKEEGETYYQVPLYTRDLCGDRNKRRKTEKKNIKVSRPKFGIGASGC